MSKTNPILTKDKKDL